MTQRDIIAFTDKLISMKNENTILKKNIERLEREKEQLSRMVINNK